MKLIIHDLPIATIENKFKKDEWIVIGKTSPIKHCIGCFGCWVKTPGVCILKDEYQSVAPNMALCDTVIIISECMYGGPSPFVKKVMDRSIGYMLPFFQIRHGKMHHKSRYKARVNYVVYFYGKDISEEEKRIAKDIVNAQAINLNAIHQEVHFFENEQQIMEVFI